MYIDRSNNIRMYDGPTIDAPQSQYINGTYHVPTFISRNTLRSHLDIVTSNYTGGTTVTGVKYAVTYDVNGSPAYGSGVWELDGINDYLESTSTVYNIMGASPGLAGWFQTTDVNSVQVIAAHSDISANNFNGIVIYINAGNIVFRVSNATSNVAQNFGSLQANKWYFFYATYDVTNDYMNAWLCEGNNVTQGLTNQSTSLTYSSIVVPISYGAVDGTFPLSGKLGELFSMRNEVNATTSDVTKTYNSMKTSYGY